MAKADAQTFKQSEKKRSENWSEEEMAILIEIWQEKIADLRQAKRNKTIYEAMVAEIRLQRPTSSARTWSGVRTKIKNLIVKYREEVTKIGHSRGSPSTWQYFQAVNSIIGHRPAQNVSLMEESCSTVMIQCLRSPELDIENNKNSDDLIEDVPVPVPLEPKIRVTRASKRKKRPLERQINELISEIKRSNAVSEELERKSIKIAEEGLQLQRESVELRKELLSVIKMSN
ncbi:myb/SANT-like DNA-binding domain-containing protein 1 [Centruroides vittatus]|uniref:myb/SANT-like DNA-binding domain-containing protein 1 n=1 Tax=Centruroides vittatus TaxID=120091 RepID=UPI00350F085A